MLVKKILIDKKGNIHYWIKGDLHTQFGVVKEQDIEKTDGILKSNWDKEFLCFNASFIDQFNKLNRGPAVPHIKDIAYIITYTGINKDSKILDAGTGCGFLALFLANISDNVTSYESNKETLKIAEGNIKKLNLKIKLKNKDIYQGIEEKDLDLITLDLLEPWLVLPHAEKSLKHGAFLVSYLPNITQVQKLIEESKRYNFYQDKILELIEREWIVNDKIVRPKNQIIGHTAFLVFLRKI